MMRPVSSGSGEYCVDSRPSCLAEDGRLSPSHFDLCPTKFYQSSSTPRPRQTCFTYLPPPVPGLLKAASCRQETPQPQGPAGAPGPNTKKKGASGRSGKRGRPTGTTKLAGYRTSTGRPLGTTKAAGFKTSPGRPLGTTKAAGYKVSPGRPPGSIKGQSRLSKVAYNTCSAAAFPYSIMNKPAAGETALKEEENTESPKVLLQAPPFLLSGFPIRSSKSPPPLSLMSAEVFSQACPDGGPSRGSLTLPIHSALPSYS